MVVQDKCQCQIITCLQIRDISRFETQTRHGNVAYLNIGYLWRFFINLLKSPFEVNFPARMSPLVKPNIIDVLAVASKFDIVIHSKADSIYHFLVSTHRADNLTLIQAIHFYFLDLHTQQKPGSEACSSNSPCRSHRGAITSSKGKKLVHLLCPGLLWFVGAARTPFSTGEEESLAEGDTRETRDFRTGGLCNK